MSQKDKTQEKFLEEIALLKERIAELEAAGPGDKKGTEEKLLLLKILDESPDFIGVADLQGKLLYHNRAARRMVGLPEDADLSHMKIRDMHPAWAAKLVEEEGIPAALSRGTWKSENALLHRNGNEIPVSQVLALHRDPSGKPIFISTIMRDITEQKKAWEGLARFKALFESSQDAIMTLEPPDWKFTSGNLATVKMFGAGDEAAFISKGPWELSPEFQPDGRASSEKAPKMIQKAVEEGTHFFEWTHKRINGEEFFATVLLTRVEIEKGKPFLQATVRDISAQKIMDENLARVSRENELILKSSMEGILGLDLQGRHTFVNPAAAKLLGYEAGELLGRPSHMTWHHTKPDGSSYPKEECAIYAAYRDGAVHRVSTEVFWRKDGTSFPVEYTSTPIHERNRLAGAVVVFSDITERKKAEEALKNSEAMFKSIVTTVPIGLGIASNRKIEWTNDYLLALVGRQKTEVIGKDARILYENEKAYLEAGSRLYADLKTKGIAETETVWKHKSGWILNIYLKGVVLEQKDVSPKIFFCVTDITELKATEEKKRKQLRELEIFYKASIGREERILELKKEVEQLKKELGK